MHWTREGVGRLPLLAACEYVGERSDRKKADPDDAESGIHPDGSGARPDVHEKNNDEERFGESNTERDYNIQRAKIHIDGGDGGRKKREKPQVNEEI